MRRLVGYYWIRWAGAPGPDPCPQHMQCIPSEVDAATPGFRREAAPARRPAHLRRRLSRRGHRPINGRMTIRSKNLSSAIKRGLKGLPAASLALLAAGCAVGPNFVRPAAPSVRRYTEQPLPASTASADVAGGNAQRFLIGADIPAQWWRLFRSKPLDALIEEALASSPTLQAAQAALTRAQEPA